MPRSERSQVETPMESRPHALEVEARQAAIYRAMTPARRLRQALRLHALMRRLMDAGLRAQHPEWSDEERRRVIADRIRHARTG